MKSFDLNIDKILENWECKDAVREIIANALDEQTITDSANVEIFKDYTQDCWVIKDFGRGLKPEHLVQNENSEKIIKKGIIGKFGIGLKDALATFDRHGVIIKIFSRYADITVRKMGKNNFDKLETLHAIIQDSSYPNMIGTRVELHHIDDGSISFAKDMFLRFSKDCSILETTKYGQVVESNEVSSSNARIYINGVLVATEPNFLFSYNITEIDSILKKNLNRERTNVGRAAYASIIKRILLNCNSEKIAKKLSYDLSNFSIGTSHDELRWLDIQQHAAKILSNSQKVVLITQEDAISHTDLVKEASDTGRIVVAIPENLQRRIEQQNDQTPNTENKISTLTEFVKSRENNFEYNFVESTKLTTTELSNYKLINNVFNLLGGKPENVKYILISETMQRDNQTFYPTLGLWDERNNRIIIKRSVVNNKSEFLGVFIHELAHAISGAIDSTRKFENELTRLLGIFASKLL